MNQRRKTNPFIQITLAMTFVLASLMLLISGLDPFGVVSSTPQPETNPQPAANNPWQVYFTDPESISSPTQWNQSLGSFLEEAINQAVVSIDIAGYEFNLAPMAEALLAAHRRGVAIRWITDDEDGLEADGQPGRGYFAMLVGAGIPVKDDGRSGLMHNKFMIVDSKTTWTGSLNFTQNDLFRNNNNLIVFNSPELAAIYTAEFNEMWAGQFGPGSPSQVGNQYLTIDGTPIQALFAPEDDVRAWLLPLVEGAESSITFMAFSFTDDPLGQAMMERIGQGVKVSGIFERRASETDYSELPFLHCAGASVRQDGNPGTMHHKVIVVDEQFVITGSFNFTQNATSVNDENALLIANPQIAQLYLAEFNRLWTEATDPDPDVVKCP